jgi:hypothetical protein
LGAILKIVGMSRSRYERWSNKRVVCALDDRSSCPRTQPTRATPDEIQVVKDMVLSTEYRHLSVSRLALLAQRLQRAFLSPGVWYRLIRERGWKRPRARVYPDKPKVGLRATKPNEIWHVDLSFIRLIDGTKVLIQAVIDNFSRRATIAHCAPRARGGRRTIRSAAAACPSSRRSRKLVRTHRAWGA